MRAIILALFLTACTIDSGLNEFCEENPESPVCAPAPNFCEENPSAMQCMDAEDLIELIRAVNGDDENLREWDALPVADPEKGIEEKPSRYLHAEGAWDLPPTAPSETALGEDEDKTVEPTHYVLDFDNPVCVWVVDPFVGAHRLVIQGEGNIDGVGLWLTRPEPFNEGSIYQDGGELPTVETDGYVVTLLDGIQVMELRDPRTYRRFEVKVLSEELAVGAFQADDLCSQRVSGALCQGTLRASFECDPEIVFEDPYADENTPDDDSDGNKVED